MEERKAVLQKSATILMTLFLALIPTPKGWCFLSIFIDGSVGLIMEPAPAGLVGLSGGLKKAGILDWLGGGFPATSRG